MTHDEMEISLSLIFLKIGVTGLGKVERVFNRVVTDSTVESGRSDFTDEAKQGMTHY